MYLIGDVHGKFKRYAELTRRLPCSIQLGDMAIGWNGVVRVSETQYFPDDIRHRFLRGNHDNPDACRQKKSYLGDFGYLEDDGIFFVSGAWSIDKSARVVGISWWDEEELSMQQCNDALALYEKVCPSVVLSHEAPFRAYEHLDIMYGGRNRTASLLESMMEIHEPERWVFAHHHMSHKFQIGKTRFRVLKELEVDKL